MFHKIIKVLAVLAVTGLLLGLLIAVGLYMINKRYPNHNLYNWTKVKKVLLGKEVLLRDYDPVDELRVKQTPITRARFKVIDMNTHLSDSTLSADQLVEAFDQVGVEKVVDFDGGWGDALKESVKKYRKPYPSRFLIFVNSNFLWEPAFRGKVGAPYFGAITEKLLRDASAAGAVGLKVYKDVGLSIWDTEHKRVPMDDSRFDPLWNTARELGFLLVFHVGDPSAFFRPIDARNERYEELTTPGEEAYIHAWLPPKYPSKEELHREFEKLMQRYPDTTFVATHMAMAAENLADLGGLLDRNPNMLTDISTEVDELGRQPYTTRRFLIHYQDRVMFGTDGGKFWEHVQDAVDEYRDYFRFMETDDEFFDYPLKKFYKKGRWKIYGVNLPDSVLEKIYHKNAEKLLDTLHAPNP